MNLSNINEKSSAIFRLIQQSFTQLQPYEIAYLCGWIGASTLRGNIPKSHNIDSVSISLVSEMFYTELLSDSEFADYITHKKARRDENEKLKREQVLDSQADIRTDRSSINDEHPKLQDLSPETSRLEERS